MGLCRRWGGGLGLVLSLKFARAELTPTFVARAGTFSPNNGKGLMLMLKTEDRVDYTSTLARVV